MRGTTSKLQLIPGAGTGEGGERQDIYREEANRRRYQHYLKTIVTHRSVLHPVRFVYNSCKRGFPSTATTDGFVSKHTLSFADGANYRAGLPVSYGQVLWQSYADRLRFYIKELSSLLRFACLVGVTASVVQGAR